MTKTSDNCICSVDPTNRAPEGRITTEPRDVAAVERPDEDDYDLLTFGEAGVRLQIEIRAQHAGDRAGDSWRHGHRPTRRYPPFGRAEADDEGRGGEDGVPHWRTARRSCRRPRVVVT
jgi:hypothetical protein